MTWSARLVDPDGTVIVDLDGATVGELHRSLNRPATIDVTIPATHDAVPYLVDVDGVDVPEVQVFRGSDLVLWGIPVTVSVTQAGCSIGVADLLWLLTKRHVGALYDTNLLTNPSFETGDFTGWDTSSVDTPTVDLSVNAIDGDYVARLDSSTNDPSVNKAAVQDVTIGTLTDAAVFIASFYAWVDPLTGFHQTDYDLGLVLQLFDGADPDTDEMVDEWWYKLPESTDRTYWTRCSVPLIVPAHTGDWTLRVALASPKGVVFWDGGRLVESKRLSFLGADQATIAEALIEHAQDTTYGKTDLNIDTDCSATGVQRDRIYTFAEHEEILQALIDLAEVEAGFDFAMVCDAGTGTRTFTTYYPQKGSAEPVATLRWRHGDPTSNIADDWSVDLDLDQAAGSVAVLGEGTTDADGRADDRERAWAVDTVAHGARRLEVLEVAPPRSTTGSMQALADEALAVRKVPVMLTANATRQAGDDWGGMVAAGTLDTGDVVTVDIEHGQLTITTDYRIVDLHLDTQSEQLGTTLELVRPLGSS